ncbi:MAG TPA: M20/M25/M40 family metallo-hydrolase [Candidatus Polarisedimenticolia bacterium]|jgi:acetylornithine deacetylase/succinyl-diaminopimelate desuccinylase-like protein
MSGNGFSRESLLDYAASERRNFETTLREIVEIPTVSVDPAHKGDCARGAAYAADLIRRVGGEASLIETKGHPIVIGSFHRDDSYPTVTVYNHLDVQPAVREDGWNTEPFVFTERDGRYYARGTTDDKGPAMTALWGARYALDKRVKVNVRLLWETEEEIGSPCFESAIRAEKERLATDTVIVSDTVWVSRARPACPAGLRGLQGFRLTLETGQTDQHSGTSGGAARNPITELCQLISECVDGKTGKVRIPGFYKEVEPPSKKEIEDLRKCGFTTAGFKKDHLFKSLRVTDPLEIMKRIWCMPTFEVHGIAGGYQGPGIKTIIPPRATAIVSCRLVPDMNEKRIIKLVKDFVRKKNPDVKVEVEHGLPAYRGVTTGPHPDAIRAAVKFAFGKEPVFVREGGSIGAVLSMERTLKSPVFFLGLSLPEHGYHAPNENYDWSQAEGGMAAFAEYFRLVGEMGRVR